MNNNLSKAEELLKKTSDILEEVNAYLKHISGNMPVEDVVEDLNRIINGPDQAPVQPVVVASTPQVAPIVQPKQPIQPEQPVKPAQPAHAERDSDGIYGSFDGWSMITPDGVKYDVPANYAAKSKIVYGDELRMEEKDGRQLYKTVTKVPRKEITGFLDKRDEGWYLVNDTGSYKVSSVSATFFNAENDDEAIAEIPANLEEVPFATLIEVKNDSNVAGSLTKSNHVGAPTSLDSATPYSPKNVSSATPQVNTLIERKEEVHPRDYLLVDDTDDLV